MQEREEGCNHASLTSKKRKTYRRRRMLAAHITNKNILCFCIKYENENFIVCY